MTVVGELFRMRYPDFFSWLSSTRTKRSISNLIGGGIGEEMAQVATVVNPRDENGSGRNRNKGSKYQKSIPLKRSLMLRTPRGEAWDVSSQRSMFV